MATEIGNKETLAAILIEAQEALQRFGPHHSAHESYAVLLEEVDELWDAVRRKQGPNRDEAMRKECIQVAAMALRMLHFIDNVAPGQAT